VLTGRDCFAFLFMILTLVGLERTALFIFAGVGIIWLIYIIVSSLVPAQPVRRRHGMVLDFLSRL
jgi:hypothetical protein